MTDIAAEMKATKKISPERIALLAKQNRDTMMEMDPKDLTSFIAQAEVDSRRLNEAVASLSAAARYLQDNMITAYDVAAQRGIRIS